MRPRRVVPPVGYRPSASALLRAIVGSQIHGEAAVTRLLAEVRGQLGVHAAFGVSSGKAALAIVLSALHSLSGRRKVILPAYTCFSVPSAVVKAGLEPVPCDIGVGGFDYDYGRLQELLDDDVLCVLSIHLFGIPADTARVRALCAGRGIFVVEDAAQALGVDEQGSPLGTRGDAGVYSLGRGKNVTCGGGGLIVTTEPTVTEAVKGLAKKLPRGGRVSDVSSMITLAAMGVLISPSLYWLPAGIPWLQLGETVFDDAFPLAALSAFGAAFLAGWPATLARLNAVRRAHARFYVEHIPGLRDFGDVPYLRFPVVVSAEERRRLLFEDDNRSLGISGMYPTAVGGIPQLRGRFQTDACPEADRLASGLVTLPTHPLVSGRDRDKICELMSAVLERDTEARPHQPRRPVGGGSWAA